MMDVSLLLLIAIAFLEAIILPFPPPDVIILALSAQNPSLWWLYAIVSTVSSVVGGSVGFHLGSFLKGKLRIDVG